MPTGIYARTEQHRKSTALSSRGRKHTKETKLKIANTKLAELNPMWKGNQVGLAQLHDWIRPKMNTPKICKVCNSRENVDLANKSGEYKRDLSDWKWLCRTCHMREDGRIYNLKNQEKRIYE